MRAPSLLLLSSPRVTAPGRYDVDMVNWDRAAEVAQEASSIDSAIGHEATAEAVARILGVQVGPSNRREVKQQPGQVALAAVPGQRLPEGRVLSLDELAETGLVFWLMRRTA